MEGGIRQWRRHPHSFEGAGATGLLLGSRAPVTRRGTASTGATALAVGVFLVWGRTSCWLGETTAERRDNFTALW